MAGADGGSEGAAFDAQAGAEDSGWVSVNFDGVCLQGRAEERSLVAALARDDNVKEKQKQNAGPSTSLGMTE